MALFFRWHYKGLSPKGHLTFGIYEETPLRSHWLWSSKRWQWEGETIESAVCQAAFTYKDHAGQTTTTKDCFSPPYPIFILSDLLHLKPFCTFALSHLSCDLLVVNNSKKKKSVKLAKTPPLPLQRNKEFYM